MTEPDARSDEARALEIGRAFLEAQRAADSIVGDARRQAAAILDDASARRVDDGGREPAGRPSTSTAPSHARDSSQVTGMLTELDLVEAQLRDRRAKMIEVLDHYLDATTPSAASAAASVAPPAMPAAPTLGSFPPPVAGSRVEIEAVAPPAVADAPAPPAIADAPAPPAVADAPARPVVADAPARPVVAEALDRPAVADAPAPPAVAEAPDEQTPRAAHEHGPSAAPDAATAGKGRLRASSTARANVLVIVSALIVLAGLLLLVNTL